MQRHNNSRGGRCCLWCERKYSFLVLTVLLKLKLLNSLQWRTTHPLFRWCLHYHLQLAHFAVIHFLDGQVPVAIMEGQVHTVRALLILCPFQLRSKLPMKVKTLVMHSNSQRKRKKCLKPSSHAHMWISSILQDLEGLMGSNFMFFNGVTSCFFCHASDVYLIHSCWVLQTTLTAGPGVKIMWMMFAQGWLHFLTMMRGTKAAQLFFGNQPLSCAILCSRQRGSLW